MIACSEPVSMTFTSDEHYHVSSVWNFCHGCGRKVVSHGI